jgi:hypothetical protein
VLVGAHSFYIPYPTLKIGCTMPKKKAAKLAAAKQPPKQSSYRRILSEFAQTGNLLSCTIAQLADKHGMSPAAIATCPDILEQAGLDLEDMSPHAVHTANQVFRTWDHDLRQRVTRLGGSWVS